MKHALVVILLALTGCRDPKETWYDAYIAVVSKWQAVYAGPDAHAAYEATKSFIEYMKKMERDGRPFEYARVQTWNYARLALLADHLGRKEESVQWFAAAARCAKKSNPAEPEDRISEAAFRGYLDLLDTPEKVAWRKK
jgi:hypothetical protein